MCTRCRQVRFVDTIHRFGDERREIRAVAKERATVVSDQDTTEEQDQQRNGGGRVEITELEPKLLSDLHMVAGELGIKNFRKYSKQDLIMKILTEQSPGPRPAVPHRPAGHPARRVRVPAHAGLHPIRLRHLRVAVADQAFQAAPRRRDHRPGAHAARQREVPRAAQDPDRQRHGSRAGAAPSQLRLADAALPRRASAPRDHPRPPRPPGSWTYHVPHRQGAARPDRLAAQGGQDDHPQGHSRTPSRPTTPRCTCWCCSSTSGPRRSPTWSGRSTARW